MPHFPPSKNCIFVAYAGRNGVCWRLRRRWKSASCRALASLYLRARLSSGSSSRHLPQYTERDSGHHHPVTVKTPTDAHARVCADAIFVSEKIRLKVIDDIDGRHSARRCARQHLLLPCCRSHHSLVVLRFPRRLRQVRGGGGSRPPSPPSPPPLAAAGFSELSAGGVDPESLAILQQRLGQRIQLEGDERRPPQRLRGAAAGHRRPHHR